MSRTRLPVAGGILLIAAVVAVVIIAVSGGSTSKAQAVVAPASAISVSQTPLGKTLVDANGRTLYLFEGDRPGVSTLSAAGQAVWPPFTAAAKPRALNGATASEISIIKDANGSNQVAYAGHPLYYYVGDHKSGQTLGQNLNEFGARWYVLTPTGAAITSAPSSSSAAPSTSTSGYTY